MRQPSRSVLFAAACLLPAALILIAAAIGGVWLWLALGSLTFLVVGMDRFGGQAEADAPWIHALPVTVGFVHFAVLAATMIAVGANGPLDSGQKVLLVVAVGLYAGQVSNACAHELIHRRDAFSRRLGTAIYCSILNGHHVSAHLLVHHVHAGTPQDPNSAPLGQGFYRYLATASIAEYRAGLAAETKRSTDRGVVRHPYALYTAGAALSLVVSWVVGGVWGMFALLAISLHAQAQLLLSDYVQHYGLRRRIDPTGKPEPMGPQHSWNAPHRYSAALMMNAPRHSDHHMNPSRDFSQLRLDEQMPTLPRSVPVMGAVALCPPLWRHMMDRRAQKWSDARSMPAETPSAFAEHAVDTATASKGLS